MMILQTPASFIFIVLSIPAHATLIDWGNGLVYDDDLDITWLQDANYAMTTGYDADGLMTWSEAMIWAENLVYFDLDGGLMYDNWRLPSDFGTTPVPCTGSP